MAADLNLYRKRYIPKEMILLKDDEILHAEPELIVTKWNVLKPRKDMARGYSAYYINKNIKISKIYDAQDALVYWYCDIIHTEMPDEKTYIFHDLLVDVIVPPSGFPRVVDLDEIADVMESPEGFPKELIAKAMRATNNLLSIIYDGQFKYLTRVIEEYEQ